MQIIIVGMGRVGASLTRELLSEGHDIVVIESNPDILQECINKFDVQGICGKGCNSEILKEAGVEKCDMLISVMPQDESNILCCIVARELGAKNLIARVRDPAYFTQFEFLRNRLGIGMLVNPEESAAREIIRILRFPVATKVSSFSRGKVDIVEYKLSSEDKLVGLTLAEIRKKLKFPALIVAIERAGDVVIPDGNITLHADDVVSVCAKHLEIGSFFRTFGIFKQKAVSVVILGGGDDAFYLARNLEESGFSVKIICNSYERCLEIKGGLKKTEVVFGDYTDRDVLEREGISFSDAVVSMSHYDENNIVTSMYARSRGVEKPIAILRGDGYRGILETVKVDTAISPYRLAAAEVARYVRAVNVDESSRILAMYKLAEDRAEALLFRIGGNESFSGKKLMDLPLRKGILIAAVIRGKNVFIPDGSFVLGESDEIIVVCSGKIILELEDILAS